MVKNLGERVVNFVKEALDGSGAIVDALVMLVRIGFIGRDDEFAILDGSVFLSARRNRDFSILAKVIDGGDAPNRLAICDDFCLAAAETTGGDQGAFAVTIEQDLLLDDLAQCRKQIGISRLGAQDNCRAADFGDLWQVFQQIGQLDASQRCRTERIQAAQIGAGTVVGVILVPLFAHFGQEVLRNRIKHC